MENVNIPDFMKKYHKGSDYEGQAHIELLAKQYEADRQKFMETVFPKKLEFQRDWDKTMGTKTKLDPEAAAAHIKQSYEEKVAQTAREFGYTDDSQKEEQEHRESNEQASAQPVKAEEEPINSHEEQRQAARQKFLDNLRSIQQRNISLKPRH